MVYCQYDIPTHEKTMPLAPVPSPKCLFSTAGGVFIIFMILPAKVNLSNIVQDD